MAALSLAAVTLIALIPVSSFADDPSDEASAEERRGADNVEIIYRGLLQDEDGAPVSGVFPLKFKLYRGSMSADPLWNERHFVSVVDGRYQVSLGKKNALREHLLVGDRWIGIEFGEEGEILRDAITVETPEGTAAGADRPSGQRLTHADVAEHAAEAERARVADNALALDGMTAEEIEALANLALTRLGEHIADPQAHSVAARHRIGSERRVPDGAGGRGGAHFDVRCPEGHVVTGIEGRAGRLIDYVTVACSPLQ